MKSMYGEIVLSTDVSNIKQIIVNFDLIFLAVCDQVRHKQAYCATETSYNIKTIVCVAS